MGPVDLIRKCVNTRIRLKAYVWVISIAGRSKLLLYPFLFLLHGYVPKGISIVKGKPVYHHKGFKIEAPIDSFEPYIEVFHDKVYDRLAVPKAGDIVIDIGAYVGMYSIKASQLVGLSGLIVAVEPSPSNLVYLKSNLKGYQNTRIVEVALSNYVGDGKLYSSPGTEADSLAYKKKNYRVVRITTLDDLVKELGLSRVDYIKMDAEGSDLNILEGAIGTLRKDYPVLSLACYHPDLDDIPCFGKVITYLKNLGYKCITKNGYVYAQKEG